MTLESSWRAPAIPITCDTSCKAKFGHTDLLTQSAFTRFCNTASRSALSCTVQHISPCLQYCQLISRYPDQHALTSLTNPVGVVCSYMQLPAVLVIMPTAEHLDQSSRCAQRSLESLPLAVLAESDQTIQASCLPVNCGTPYEIMAGCGELAQATHLMIADNRQGVHRTPILSRSQVMLQIKTHTDSSKHEVVTVLQCTLYAANPKHDSESKAENWTHDKPI